MNERKSAGRLPEERIARIRMMKRVLIIAIAAALLLPTLLCIYLLIRISDMEERMNELIETRSESIYLDGKDKLARTTLRLSKAGTVLPETATDGAGEEKGADGEAKENPRTVYLTFDDGPSVYTGEILDILKEYGVKATFFVVGTKDPARLEDYRRIVREGHTIGIHSYSHQYKKVYASADSFMEDVSDLRELIYETTGVFTSYYRFPGGSSNQVSSVDMKDLIRILKDSGIRYFDWNVSSGDATSQAIDKETALRNTFRDAGLYSEAMVLLHDTSDKRTTVEALPEMIERFREMGADLKAVDETTSPIQHVKAEDIR